MPSTTPSRVPVAKLPLVVFLLLAFSVEIASAQAPAPSDTPAPPAPGQYVLHAYADLLRIPALVLDRNGVPMPLLAQDSFSLQIDSGPAFHPVAMHIEGNEPINLAIVLDASGASADLLKTLPLTPDHGLPTTLLPQDTVSLFAFDCRSFRSALDLPSSHPDLQDAVDRALAPPRLHNPKGKSCRDTKRLWEAINLAAQDLAAQPGWRALIVLSDGQDGGSRIKWGDLWVYASFHSITLFGLRDEQEFSATTRMLALSGFRKPSEDLFAEMASRTGGLILNTDAGTLAPQLDRIVAMLRSRYILQFSRPARMTGGVHHLDVRESARDALVLTAGASAPTRDATLLNDPTTVPSDVSKLPVPGNRKPLKP